MTREPGEGGVAPPAAAAAGSPGSGSGSAAEDPIARFEREHDEALEILERLEGAIERLLAGEDPVRDLRTVADAHAFLAGAVRRHNEDEERALFPLLDDAPTDVFVEEHRTLRELEEALLKAARASDAPTTARTALPLIELLRSHIRRENEVLFPLARQRLGAKGMAEVARRLGIGSG